MFWMLLLIPLAAGIGLSRLAAPDTLGAIVPMVMGSVVALGLCWRAFERLLWLRFRTKAEHTVAARRTCQILAVLLALQVGCIAMGI